MQYLGPALAVTRSHVLANFPVHRCLQTILDCECAALDKEIAFQRRKPDYTVKRLDKFRVAGGVNVRVCDLDFRGTQKISSHFRIVEVRMVKPNRHGAEK